MSGWRVQQHYGFGAARVALAARPHRYPQSIGDAMRDAGGDFYLSALPPILLAAFVSAALFVTVSEDRGYTDVEVVMIERGLHGLDEEVAQLPPEAVPDPEPAPPPVQKVALKKPPPPPPAKKKIAPPEPPPVQKLAAKPKPAPKPRPVAKARPKPKPKPKLALAALTPLPGASKPAPPRRTKRAAPEAAKPRIDLVPAIAPALALEAVDEPERPRRFASVRQAPSRRPKADMGPPIAARALTAPAPEPPPVRSRRAAPRAPAAAPRRAAPLDFAAAAAPPPAAPARRAPEHRRSGPVQAERPRRAAAPPATLPALAAAVPRQRAPAEPPPSRARDRDRTQRNAGTRQRSDRSGGRGLQGVPLASLAACLSDRDEDALKRRLVAAVTTQRECVSPAGTYRFIETKNLNAFLMTIDRAAGRAEADRCVELSYALECVGG